VLPLEEALSSLYRRLADETTVIPRAITTAAGHRASRAAFLSREFIVRAPSSPRVRMRASFRTPRNNRSFNSDAGGSSLSPSRIIRAHNARLFVIAHAFRRERLYLSHVVSRAGFIIAAAMICRIATSPLPPPYPLAPPLLRRGRGSSSLSRAQAAVYQVYELNCRFITPEGRTRVPPRPSPSSRSSFHFYHLLGGKNAPARVESDSVPFY